MAFSITYVIIVVLFAEKVEIVNILLVDCSVHTAPWTEMYLQRFSYYFIY